jgi:hypothetical protein
MDLGEKLTAISSRVYSSARDQLSMSGVSPSLAVVIMENVLARFQADAYRKINAEREMEEAREMARAEQEQKAAEAAKAEAEQQAEIETDED